jgi:hypothetical protein
MDLLRQWLLLHLWRQSHHLFQLDLWDPSDLSDQSDQLDRWNHSMDL